MGVTAGYGDSNAVDLYNGASGTWSTAQLSVARDWSCCDICWERGHLRGGLCEVIAV